MHLICMDECAREIKRELISTSSIINLLDSSNEDASNLSYADDSCIFIESATEDSVFDLTNKSLSSISSGGKDDSITDAKSQPLKRGVVDSPVAKAYNILGVRFEQGKGTGIIRNDLIKYNPVANAELMTADDTVLTTVSYKNPRDLAGNDIEIFCQEQAVVENSECLYVDLKVQVLFSEEALGDPRIFSNGEMEGHPLGSSASYRTKIIDASNCYLSTLYKYNSLRTGPIAQRLPDAINGRDFISRARADRMKVPYDIKEARERFDRIVAKFQLKWIDDKSCFKEQLDLVIDALRIGAFCLPRQVLESGIIEMHLIDSLQKDLGRCMDALRKGLTYTSPCNSIGNLLEEYLRVTTDQFPYFFYGTSHSVTHASSRIGERSMASVVVHLNKTVKRYKMFQFHVHISESFYPNLYFGLTFYQPGKRLVDTLGRVRKSELPKFKVSFLKTAANGEAMVTTPPPSDASHFKFQAGKTPKPLGKFHITIDKLCNVRNDLKLTFEETVKTIKMESEDDKY